MDRGTPSGTARFVEVDPAVSGLQFRNELFDENIYPYLYNGAGLAIGDYDGDGRPDVFMVSQDGANRLFRQTEAFRFVDVTDQAGLTDDQCWGIGASFADVDGDRDLDLYVCNLGAPNRLWINDGNGHFVDRAPAMGLDHVGASTMGSFADYDRDGDLDLYLLTNRAFSGDMWAVPGKVLERVRIPAGTQQTLEQLAPRLPQLQRAKDGQWEIPAAYRDHVAQADGQLYFCGQPDRLFRNDGARFVDVTKRAGIADQGMGLSATWWDADGDLWPDLYVANDLESPDRLYRNRGDGTFEDITQSALPRTAYFGMGSDFGDVDGDGRFDLMVADMASTTHLKAKWMMGDMGDRGWFLANLRPSQQMRNALYLNSGTHRFHEISALAGVSSSDWTWSVLFGDLDCDGREDLFVTNGVPRFDMNPDLVEKFRKLSKLRMDRQLEEEVRNIPPFPERNLAFRNVPGLKFERATEWGLEALGVSHGAALADLDRDGDLDLVVSNLNAAASLYRNQSADGARVVIELRGSRGNSATRGVGARIELDAGGATQVRMLTLARGYCSGTEPVAVFGLGAAERVDRLTVAWPSGHEQSFEGLSVNRRFVIAEPAAKAKSATATQVAPAETTPGWYHECAQALGLGHRHREASFDDFAEQPLLPYQLSRLGPGLAVADCTGDGHAEVWVGGAAGQAGRLFCRSGDRYVEVGGPWSEHAASEDMGACWLDIDGDRDLDLFVVSGGNEAPAGDDSYRDRIYRNDGVGADGRPKFSATSALEWTDSGSAVAAADFDGDGDTDLVVGTRVLPRRFPRSGPSRLLRNDGGGKFVDVTDRVAPALATAGQVTGLEFVDLDGDGRLDLILSAHWQPIRWLKQSADGRFVDRTDSVGLDGVRGWWNAVRATDLDGDGDLDLVATNYGTNHKYHPTAARPARIYSADFDGNGRDDVVEAKVGKDARLLPVRGRSCSSNAIPALRSKFTSYEQFAKATLGEIYTPEKLAEALVLEANELRSGVFWNRGSSGFEFVAFGPEVQVAPAFGIGWLDADADGRTEVFLAQNFSAPEPETGPMISGLGALVRVSAGGKTASIPARTSGVLVAEDGRGVAVVDLDGDQRKELLVATSDGPLRVFTRND